MKDIEDRIKELEYELKELREKMEEQKEYGEPKPWKPEVKEEYFYVYSNLKTGRYFNLDDSIDDKLVEVGNCFKTRERAEQVADKMRLLLKLEQLHDMLCPDYVPDWKFDTAAYTLDYNPKSKRWSYALHTYNCHEVYFETKENALKAVEILNKELELNEK